MRQILKKCAAAAFLLSLLLLSGCSAPKLNFNPQDLYKLPTLPAKYTELNTQLQAILEGGAEYIAPLSGANIQPVQMVDLDGDGREEAVAFFRNVNDEKPLKIYIFTAKEEKYQLATLIEGNGTGIFSVAYEDLNGDGIKEMAVGWKATAELQVLEIYSRCPQGAEILVQSNYVKYIMTDLDQDERQEVVVIRANEDGEGVADYYGWKESALTLQSSARISMTMAELNQQGRVTRGVLEGKRPALFITGVTEMSRSITDILAVRNGELTNIVLSEMTGVSSQIAPYAALYPSDINGDGITEVPWPVQMTAVNDSGLSYQYVDWYQYDLRGKATTVLQTYHNAEDRWYFRLPESWLKRVWISRATMQDESTVTFSILREKENVLEPFLKISTITGHNRDVRAVQGDCFILSRQQSKIYTAELLDANETWRYGMTADEVREAFSLIAKEWTAGDN